MAVTKTPLAPLKLDRQACPGNRGLNKCLYLVVATNNRQAQLTATSPVLLSWSRHDIVLLFTQYHHDIVVLATQSIGAATTSTP